VIDESAYNADISFWNASKNRLPVLISHDWQDESANIGHVQRLEAVPGYGLVAHMRLDLSNPRAKYIHKLLSERRMVEWSIGYDLLPGGEQKQADGSSLLTHIHLIEVSVVLKGAAAILGERQGRTELLGVKTRGGFGPDADLNRRLDALLPAVKSDVVDEFIAATRALDAEARAATEAADERLTSYAEEPREQNISDEDLLTLNPGLRRLAREDDVDA
jgi:HK97 family phage prohead protease